MIYFVFALIVAAALLYLIFSEGRTLRQGVTQALSELTRLKERAKSIKTSLKSVTPNIISQRSFEGKEALK